MIDAWKLPLVATPPLSQAQSVAPNDIITTKCQRPWLQEVDKGSSQSRINSSLNKSVNLTSYSELSVAFEHMSGA